MFDPAAYLAACRDQVDSTLERILPSAAVPPAILHEAMRYSVFGGGKRIRPALAFAAAECAGANRVVAVYPAAAVELLHTYTLIHDDLPCMDNDDFRRGQPTCHKQFGDANALLAGDALLTLAFETAASTPVAPAAVVHALAAAAGSRGVVGGQVADLAATANVREDELIFIHEHKTADLFRAAVEMGALAAGAPPALRKTLSDFGRAAGLAFQIVDDLLDDADPNDSSFSCVSIMGRQRAEALAGERTAEAMNALRACGNAAVPLRAVARFLLERTA